MVLDRSGRVRPRKTRHRPRAPGAQNVDVGCRRRDPEVVQMTGIEIDGRCGHVDTRVSCGEPVFAGRHEAIVLLRFWSLEPIPFRRGGPTVPPTATDLEHGSAAVVDPDPLAVAAPVDVLLAGPLAEPIDEPDTAGRVRAAVLAPVADRLAGHAVARLSGPRTAGAPAAGSGLAQPLLLDPAGGRTVRDAAPPIAFIPLAAEIAQAGAAADSETSNISRGFMVGRSFPDRPATHRGEVDLRAGRSICRSRTTRQTPLRAPFRMGVCWRPLGWGRITRRTPEALQHR